MAEPTLTNRLSYELYRAAMNGAGADITLEQWCRGIAPGCLFYFAQANRVLELLERGDAAAPMPEGGVEALRLGLGVDECDQRAKERSRAKK